MSIVTKATEGNHGLIEMQKEYTWSKTGGVSENRVWIGSHDDIDAKFSSNRLLAIQPISMTMARIGDSMRWKLSATFASDPSGGTDPGTTEAISNTYELEDNQIQMPTCQNKILADMITDGAVNGIKEIFDQYAAQKLTLTAATKQVSDLLEEKAVTGDAADEANLFFDDLMKGVDTYYDFHTVFRRTLTAVTKTQVGDSFTGIKKIWTTDQINTWEGLTGNPGIFFTLPTLQWLKLPPRVSAATNQRTQVSYEYWGADAWLTRYYETYAPSTPSTP